MSGCIAFSVGAMIQAILRRRSAQCCMLRYTLQELDQLSLDSTIPAIQLCAQLVTVSCKAELSSLAVNRVESHVDPLKRMHDWKYWCKTLQR